MADRDELVRENMGLVCSCASRFLGKGIDYDDLCQAGSIGLIKAADRFDSSLGYCFSTYAVPVILGEIKRLFRDGGAIKVSRSLKELGMKLSRLNESFIHDKGREVTVSEAAEQLGVSQELIIEALNSCSTPLSLTVSDDDGESQLDIPSPDPEIRITELLSLRQELERLSKEDRELLRLRYFSRKTQTEAASILGMTQVQVSRKEKRILSVLRSRLT